jgi:hypothetical protein
MSGAAEFTTVVERAYCPQHPGEPAAQQPQPMPASWYQIQFPLPTPGADKPALVVPSNGAVAVAIEAGPSGNSSTFE